VHEFGPVLVSDAGGVQLGGSGDTADDRPGEAEKFIAAA
jgi:hypothetical protein